MTHHATGDLQNITHYAGSADQFGNGPGGGAQNQVLTEAEQNCFRGAHHSERQVASINAIIPKWAHLSTRACNRPMVRSVDQSNASNKQASERAGQHEQRQKTLPSCDVTPRGSRVGALSCRPARRWMRSTFTGQPPTIQSGHVHHGTRLQCRELTTERPSRLCSSTPRARSEQARRDSRASHGGAHYL